MGSSQAGRDLLKRTLTIALALLALAAAAPASANALPRGFFGIVPQTGLTDTDVRYMRAGKVGSVRVPVPWDSVQPTPGGGYNWGGIDHAVAVAARGGLDVLPFLYGTPRWLARRYTTLPLSGRARGPWLAFVRAAVERYGPGGDFWRERAPGVVQYEPAIPRPRPIRVWQVWNEANFFYFAFPASPSRYAQLLKITAPVIKRADPSARVVLSGLFGDPDEAGPRGMDAVDFVERIYRTRNVKQHFDGVALHPYAIRARDLRNMTEEMREVMLLNGDRRAGLYITEMGWGSEPNYRQVAFEQGIRGQVRQLRDSYRYLIDNHRRLNLKGTYWFTWKDAEGFCSFCDSTGLFRQGERFRPKPAWHAFVGLTGGRARP